MQEPEDDFYAAFDGFGEDIQPTSPTEAPQEEPKEEPKKEEEPSDADKDNAAGGEPKDPPKPDEKVDAPADGDNPDGKPADPAPAPAPAEPVAPETPAPLTKSDVESVVSNLLSTERNTAKELDTMTQEVMNSYFPDGLSNTLVDESTGKELKTPQDVADLTGWDIEKSSQWLMNEQFKLDQQVASIKANAKEIAETTITFRRDSTEVLKRYEPLFKWKPELQQKVWDAYKPLVKADEAKGVILSAPDIANFYDTMLEPYRLAFEQSQQQPATNPPTPEPTPEPPKPTAEDRMDESGDGGASPVNDPNDFAQQVAKELAKGA